MIDLFNIGSLVFGLIAWMLPIVNLMRYKRPPNNRNWVALSILSIIACAISLCLQIFNIYHLVKIEDWSALLDTMGAVVFIATILLVVTIILNIITLIIYRNRTAK